ncbi:MAG: hypothetical protein K5659_00130 [Lachnospiraceae bacterium]|nr:hypothetical protein [Lachnospiraceae bacterium]
MRSSTKILLWGAATAALAAGAYCFYQNKEKFIKQENVLNKDGSVARQRTYVSIDPQDAKEAAINTYNKTKESVQRTFSKTRSVASKDKEYSDLFEDEDDDIDLDSAFELDEDDDLFADEDEPIELEDDDEGLEDE